LYVELRDIYLESLRRCAPERLMRTAWREDFPRDVVAIGKCAGAMLDAIAGKVRDAFVAIPEGYRLPEARAEVAVGGHPEMTRASFEAGRRLLAFVDAHDDLTFLISGGGSACVEVPLEGHEEEELIAENARLVASSLPIGAINAARRRLSAIKGGRLARRVRGRSVTLVYSDVSSGRLADVASGPTLERDDDGILVADNGTLTAAAAEIARERGYAVDEWPAQIEEDVAIAARRLADAARRLERHGRDGEPPRLLVAGGEPTVVRRGNGRGGRCSELALRFALDAPADIRALFASSDGVDGSSGAAGIEFDRIPPLDRDTIVTELARSNSFAAAVSIGRAIIIPPAGNNLRDLYLLARG
jgi:glycerate-2-kinase